MNSPLVPSDRLGTAEELGRGGYARVYRLTAFRLDDVPFELAYKRFRRKTLPVSLVGLTSIVNRRLAMEVDQRRQLDERTAWPLRVVERNGAAVGLLMRLIPHEFFQQLRLRSGATETVTRELQFLWQDQGWCSRTGVPFASVDERLRLLRGLSLALAILHKANVVYGDISATNVLYRLRPSPAIMLIDCDAVRLSGTSPVFGKQPHSPDFQPPEALAAQALLRRLSKADHNDPRIGSLISRYKQQYSVQNVPTDVYKFALVVIRTLAPGPGRSASRDPQSVARYLSRDALDLLHGSLDPTPSNRPAMRLWYSALGGSKGGRQPSEPPIPGSSQEPAREGAWLRQADGSWVKAR
jgi:serine/threonine protein kinase